MKYNYYETMSEDIKDYIEHNIDADDWKEDREGLEEKLNDDLWDGDDITGNGSGSYTFNSWTAREYVLDNTDLLKEALTEFDEKEKAIDILCDDDWETADVIIRCYLLGACINDVLDELENEGFFNLDEEIEGEAITA